MNHYQTIFINGEAFNCYKSMSLYDVLLYLNFDIHRIVVEHNQVIVSNSNFKYTTIENKDRVEIITVVGGG